MTLFVKDITFSLIIVLIHTCVGIESKDSTKFIVIGDWGGLPNPPFETDIENKTSRELVKLANHFNIDFILALGDNFYYNGVQNEYDSRFQTTFENVFSSKDLFFPWYFVAGNHDWKGNVSAQIAYSNHSSRWKFPNYCYTIEKSLPNDPNTKLAIIMIDTVLLCGNIDSDFMVDDAFEHVVHPQVSISYWKFIENELYKYKNYSYIIVAGHYPVWSVSHHGPTLCLVDKLDILLKKYNVSAYMNGHDHTLEHIQVPYGSNQSMNYFTTGAANFFDNSKKHEKSVPKNSLKFHWFNDKRKGGLAFVEMKREFISVNLLSTANALLYSTKIKPRF